jgi:predicted transposase YdaD
MEKGREAGIAEGIALGEERGEIRGEIRGEARGVAIGVAATARKLKALGLPEDTIAAATGLSPEEVAEL